MNNPTWPILLATLPFIWTANQTCAQPAPKPPATRAVAAKDLKASELKELELPKPRLVFGPVPQVPAGVDLTRSHQPRGDFLVPRNVQCLSQNKPVTLSDKEPIIGDANLINDGDVDGCIGQWIELCPGTQWVQIDLQKQHEIWAIVIWHYFQPDYRIYHDVIVQISDDPDFKKDVTTLFNNDTDNSSGRGKGLDQEYLDTEQGHLVDGRAIKARYVRCYSNGNTTDRQNHYVEIEIHGRPPR